MSDAAMAEHDDGGHVADVVPIRNAPLSAAVAAIGVLDERLAALAPERRRPVHAALEHVALTLPAADRAAFVRGVDAVRQSIAAVIVGMSAERAVELVEMARGLTVDLPADERAAVAAAFDDGWSALRNVNDAGVRNALRWAADSHLPAKGGARGAATTKPTDATPTPRRSSGKRGK